MTLRQAWISAGLIILGIAAMTAVAWPMIPPGQPIPIHFGLDGRPNRFAPAEIGLLILPGLALLVCLLLAAATARGPSAAFAPSTARSLPLVWLVVLVIFVGGQALIIGSALHAAGGALRLFFGALGCLAALLGLVTGRAAPPRFRAAAFMIAGIVLIGGAALLPRPGWLIWLTLADVTVAAVACTICSSLVSHPRRAGTGPLHRDGAA